MGPQLHRLTLLDLLTTPDEMPSVAPNNLVFTMDGQSSTAVLTRTDLARKARSFASRLRPHAVPGSRALVALPTSPEFFIAFFGCLYAGIIAAPVQAVRNAEGLESLEAIAAETGASLLIASQAMADRLQALDAAFMVRTGLRTVIVDDSEPPAEEEPDSAIIHPDPESVAYLQFTSGSTGQPRGVMISHANVFHNLAVIDAKAGRPRNRAAVSWLPLYHDMGLVSALYSLYVGLGLVLLSPMHFMRRPLAWLRAISHFGGVYSGAPNFAYELCNRAPLPAGDFELDLSSWRFAFCGAEPVRPATLRRFLKRFEPFGFRPEAISPAYGLAESTLIVTGVPAGQEAVVRRRHAASPSNGSTIPAADEFMQPSTEISECGACGELHQIRVVDPRSCHVLPDGHEGEIWVTGPSKALGYWQRPEESQATFQARLDGDDQSYLRTGDLGFLDEGRLFVTGRIKELVIVRGQNYHPRELEQAAATAHPALGPVVAAFAVTTGAGESVVLIAEVRRGSWRRSRLNEVVVAIQAELVRRLGVKADFVGLVKPGGLPRTSSGKLQRLKCRDEYCKGSLEYVAVLQASTAVEAGEPPRAPAKPAGQLPDRYTIENWIVQWLSFQMKLPAAEIDPCRPFAAHGLDSLAAVQLNQELEDWLEIPVAETLGWFYPTPAELSVHLEQALRDKTSAAPVAREAAPKATRSEADHVLQWVERLTESQVEHLFRNRSSRSD